MRMKIVDRQPCIPTPSQTEWSECGNVDEDDFKIVK
jgi:hypothetical protein